MRWSLYSVFLVSILLLSKVGGAVECQADVFTAAENEVLHNEGGIAVLGRFRYHRILFEKGRRVLTWLEMLYRDDEDRPGARYCVFFNVRRQKRDPKIMFQGECAITTVAVRKCDYTPQGDELRQLLASVGW